MRLSPLQKYILKKTWESNKARTSRQAFSAYYNNQKKSPASRIRPNIITTSIERLIDKGLLIGYGEKTQYKLFIQEVRLSPNGKKVAQSLLGQQTKLPFKKQRVNQ